MHKPKPCAISKKAQRKLQGSSWLPKLKPNPKRNLRGMQMFPGFVVVFFVPCFLPSQQHYKTWRVFVLFNKPAPLQFIYNHRWFFFKLHFIQTSPKIVGSEVWWELLLTLLVNMHVWEGGKWLVRTSRARKIKKKKKSLQNDTADDSGAQSDWEFSCSSPREADRSWDSCIHCIQGWGKEQFSKGCALTKPKPKGLMPTKFKFCHASWLPSTVS